MMISNSCSKMIQKMKRQSKLNNAAFRQLLVPALQHLDLSGVYITDSTLKLVWKNCPNLRVLSLKDCGYIVTDSIMEQLVKVKWEGDFSNIKAKSFVNSAFTISFVWDYWLIKGCLKFVNFVQVTQNKTFGIESIIYTMSLIKKIIYL